jgi:hypothetical protein
MGVCRNGDAVDSDVGGIASLAGTLTVRRYALANRLLDIPNDRVRTQGRCHAGAGLQSRSPCSLPEPSSARAFRGHPGGPPPEWRAAC